MIPELTNSCLLFRKPKNPLLTFYTLIIHHFIKMSRSRFISRIQFHFIKSSLLFFQLSCLDRRVKFIVFFSSQNSHLYQCELLLDVPTGIGRFKCLPMPIVFKFKGTPRSLTPGALEPDYRCANEGCLKKGKKS